MNLFNNKQISQFLEKPIFSKNKGFLIKIVEILNKNKILVLSGQYKIGKISIIKDFILSTKQENNLFIFDKDHIVNQYIDGNTLINQLNELLKYNKNIKIIILNNFNKIPDIKKFIQYIHMHENNFKIILISNSIKIPGVQEIEFLGNNISSLKKNVTLENIIQHGTLPEPSHLNHSYFSKQFLNLIVTEMYTKEIFNNFGVKDIEMYTLTMTYISKINYGLSLRELQKGLSEIQHITLKTTIDYVNFSIRAKILKPVYRYDFKKQKIISTRVQYYFTDTGIRNSISKYTLPDSQLKTNLLFQHGLQQGFEIFSGLNGTFESTFYWKNLSEEICIHYSQVTEKNELKKEINKLSKIPVNGKKYLILDSIEKLSIKKLIYDDVEIVEYKDFFGKFGPK